MSSYLRDSQSNHLAIGSSDNKNNINNNDGDEEYNEDDDDGGGLEMACCSRCVAKNIKLGCSSRHRRACSDRCNIVCSSRHRRAGSDRCNIVCCSRHRRAGSDRCNIVCCGRSEDSTTQTRLDTSRPALRCSGVILTLIAVCLLPGVSSAAFQNDPTSTSSDWRSAQHNPTANHTSTVSLIPDRNLSPLSRQGDNHSSSREHRNLSVPLRPIQHALLENAFKNDTDDTARKSAISASVGPKEEDDVSKIISIVVPFTCVIFAAGMLFATYKICHRYRCYKNEAGLRKCLTFCDRCMSTPHVFQLPDSKKDSNRTTSVSSDSGRLFRYSFNSVSSSSSRVSTSSAMANQASRQARQPPNTQYPSLRHSSTSSPHSSTSRQGSRSSKQSVGSISAGRQNSALISGSNPVSVRGTVAGKNSRLSGDKQHSPGRLQRQGFHLSRQSHTHGHSRASGHSRGSIQSPPQPQKVPGPTSQRQNPTT